MGIWWSDLGIKILEKLSLAQLLWRVATRDEGFRTHPERPLLLHDADRENDARSNKNDGSRNSLQSNFHKNFMLFQSWTSYEYSDRILASRFLTSWGSRSCRAVERVAKSLPTRKKGTPLTPSALDRENTCVRRLNTDNYCYRQKLSIVKAWALKKGPQTRWVPKDPIRCTKCMREWLNVTLSY